MSRESDIQELCKQVMEGTIANHNYNTGENYCPFCSEGTYSSDELKDIKHSADCAYLIAKDLSTNHRKHD